MKTAKDSVRYVPFDEIAKLERRHAVVLPEEKYAEIGTYSYGKGIFHKPPRTGLEVGDKELYMIRNGDFILQITFAWKVPSLLREKRKMECTALSGISHFESIMILQSSISFHLHEVI
jgi:hypothetical protein